jgi:hypothetical protein
MYKLAAYRIQRVTVGDEGVVGNHRALNSSTNT